MYCICVLLRSMSSLRRTGPAQIDSYGRRIVDQRAPPSVVRQSAPPVGPIWTIA
jgi:hypothetical protein